MAGGGARLHLPVESMHVLREALGNKQQQPAAQAAEEAAAGAKQRRKETCDALLASMNGALIARSIVKDEAADRRLHALAIARRIAYCLDA